MSQEELPGRGKNHGGVVDVGVHMGQNGICLVDLAEGLVGVYFSHEHSIVAWSDIQGSVDEFECCRKLAHATVGIRGPHQRLEVARIELDRLMEMGQAFLPMALPAPNQCERE